jgi:hypothetical protein
MQAAGRPSSLRLRPPASHASNHDDSPDEAGTFSQRSDETLEDLLEDKDAHGVPRASRVMLRALEKHTLAQENHFDVKAALLARQEAGPFRIKEKAARVTAAVKAKVTAGARAGARMILEAIEPLEVLEAKLAKAEAEAALRSRRYADRELQRARDEAQAHFTSKRMALLHAIERDRKLASELLKRAPLSEQQVAYKRGELFVWFSRWPSFES